MSTNEENTDIPSEASASSDAPAPAAPQPSSGSTKRPRTQSRFYSRFGRATRADAATKTEAPSIPVEGLTPEEAVSLNLKDNLPVRATMGPLSEYSPDEGERENRRDRGERRGRGERRDRGERGERRKRGPRRDRHEETAAADQTSDAPSETSTPDETPEPFSVDADSVSETHAQPSAEAQPERPRRLRFEDAAPESHPRVVHEFRPSRDHTQSRSQTEPTETAKAEPKERQSGLLGWMKSVFRGTPNGEETESTPTPEDRPNRRPRGKRGSRRGGQGPKAGARAEGASSEGDGQGPKRKRRRRRGGRGRREGDNRSRQPRE